MSAPQPACVPHRYSVKVNWVPGDETERKGTCHPQEHSKHRGREGAVNCRIKM